MFPVKKLRLSMAISAVVFLLLFATCSDDNEVTCPAPPTCQKSTCCVVSPAAVNFGTVLVSGHADTTITIKNTGSNTLNCTIGESFDHFSVVSGDGPHAIAPAESLLVVVRFEPLVAGVHDCTILTGTESCGDIYCVGTGEAPPVCSVEPASLDFGTVRIGQNLNRDFTIRNTGGGTLTGTVGESCGDYEVLAGAGAFGLAAGESLVVSVRFSPASEGALPCTIGVGTASCPDVSCTGTGEQPPALAWQSMSSGTSEYLFDVFGFAGNDVFAVGGNGTIIRYNGSAWSPMTSNTGETLRDVWGSANNDVYAVGDNGTIVHYDGASWSVMPSGTSADLQSVWGSSARDVFVVGQTGTVLHYFPGSGWSAMASGTIRGMNAVGGSSTVDVFALGQIQTIIHYDGLAWSDMSPVWSVVYYDVWMFDSNDGFAVGTTGGVNNQQIYRYNGSAWNRMTSNTMEDLYGVWGSSANDVFAVGNFGAVLHFDGTAWATMDTGGTMTTFWGVWGGSGEDVFAVGALGVIIHYGP